jgi:Putative DNA-binding domain
VPAPLDSRGGLDGLMEFLGDAFRRPHPVLDDADLSARSAEHVSGNDRLSPAEQVDIYRRQYFLRHVDSLADDYPGLAHVLGEDEFDAFCRAYLAACPPRRFSLRDLGDRILAFAEGYAFPEDRSALAIEMLRYEHAFIDLFDGAEPPPLDAQKLASVPEDAWDRARLVVHPLLVRMAVRYPVHRIRLAAKAGDAPPLTAPPDPEPANLVLFRGADGMIRFDELDGAAFALLAELARGEPLVPAFERVASALDPAAAEALGPKVGVWFQEWTALRWIVDVSL